MIYVQASFGSVYLSQMLSGSFVVPKNEGDLGECSKQWLQFCKPQSLHDIQDGPLNLVTAELVNPLIHWGIKALDDVILSYSNKISIDITHCD